MIPRINIVDNIIDDNTGDRISYVKTTVGYDGTTITPENEATYITAMSPLYRKKGSDYFRRVTTDGYGFIEWFVGDDLSDGVANLDAVIKLSRAGLKVKLNRGTYPLECATDTTVNTDTQPLFIEGEGEKNTKVILKTQHSKTGGTWLRGYFTASRDITLKNLTLSTQSFEDGILDQIASEYRFCTMYKPNKIKIYTPNCTFNGSISFVFQHNTYSSTSTEAEVISQYVDSVDSPNCTFNYVSKLFMFRNCYVNKLNFTDGFVNNLLGFVASAGYTEYGKLNKLVIWDNMHLNNTIIPVLTDWYHCPLVLRCHTVYYQNSSVRNLINKNKTLYPNAGGDIRGAETYALYASAENLHFNNNDISNVLGQKEDQHDNCMFKVKGADNVYARGNKITLEKQALVDSGVLETIDSPYSTINKNEFIYAMFGSTRIKVRPEGEFIFKNNKIRVPYINKKSYIPFGRVDISDNEWEIDYVGIERNETTQALFYNHLTGETSLLPGISSDLNRNKFKINAVEDSTKPLYVFGEESPAYAYLDRTSFSSYYSISNNDFIIDGIDIILGAARTPRLLYNDNKVIGTGSIQIARIGSILADNIPFANISQKIKCSGSSSFRSTSPLLWGNSEFNIYDNTHDVVVVMQTELNDWFYNNYVSNSTPILISFNIEYINSFGVLESARYLFAQTSTNQLKYLDKTTGLITNFDPRTNTNSGIIEIQEKTGKEPEVSMFMERLDTRACYFYFSGLSNISDYKLTSRVEGKAVNPVTFYDEWLAIDGSSLTSHEMLTGVQGGATGQHYHLTAAEYLIVAATELPFTNAIKSEIESKLAEDDLPSGELVRSTVTVVAGEIDLTDIDIADIELTENTTIVSIVGMVEGSKMINLVPNGYTFEWSASLVNPLNVDGVADTEEDSLIMLLCSSTDPFRLKIKTESNPSPVVPKVNLILNHGNINTTGPAYSNLFYQSTTGAVTTGLHNVDLTPSSVEVEINPTFSISVANNKNTGLSGDEPNEMLKGVFLNNQTTFGRTFDIINLDDEKTYTISMILCNDTAGAKTDISINGGAVQTFDTFELTTYQEIGSFSPISGRITVGFAKNAASTQDAYLCVTKIVED